MIKSIAAAGSSTFEVTQYLCRALGTTSNLPTPMSAIGVAFGIVSQILDAFEVRSSSYVFVTLTGVEQDARSALEDCRALADSAAQLVLAIRTELDSQALTTADRKALDPKLSELIKYATKWISSNGVLTFLLLCFKHIGRNQDIHIIACKVESVQGIYETDCNC
jgi:hypothetical protein